MQRLERRRGGHFEFSVSFGAGENDVDPDAHRLRRRRHQVVSPLRSLDAERQLGVGRFDGVQMVHVDFLDRLEREIGFKVS